MNEPQCPKGTLHEIRAIRTMLESKLEGVAWVNEMLSQLTGKSSLSTSLFDILLASKTSDGNIKALQSDVQRTRKLYKETFYELRQVKDSLNATRGFACFLAAVLTLVVLFNMIGKC